MNKYLFIYEIETGLRSHEPRRIFNKDGCEISLFCDEKSPSVSKCKAQIIVEGDVALKVHNKVVVVLSDVLDVISYVTKSPTFILRLETILKSSRGSTNREVFRQTSKTLTKGIYITDSNYASIKELIEKDADYSVLRWLRYAYRARTMTELFTYLWLGLETLVGEERIEVVCSNCGDKRYYTNIRKESVKKILVKYCYSEREFNELWKLRQKVFHGKTNLNPVIIKKLKEHADKIGPIIESILDEKLASNHRTNDTFLIANEMIENINGFYEFEASDPTEEFSMNFPTDEQLDVFHYSSDVRDDEHGFELLNFDQHVSIW